ncbi:MAG: hypothetical protein ACRDHK_11200, partial [Actinomycetota bacterium]
AEQVVVGANGQVWVALDGATAPTDATTDPNTVDSDYANLGFASEEGATFNESKEITDIGAWQSFYPIRKIVTARAIAVSFMLRQWNRDTIEFALGGDVTGSTGDFEFTPPSPEELDLRALILDWQDGDKNYRLYVPSGIVTGAVETNLVRTGAADLPIEFSAIDPGGADIYTIFTDDPAFGPTGS